MGLAYVCIFTGWFTTQFKLSRMYMKRPSWLRGAVFSKVSQRTWSSVAQHASHLQGHNAITKNAQTAYESESEDALRRKRRTSWKRRQQGQAFLDYLIINVRGGRGGDGCVAFHREKFKQFGPPSGGNGAPGGSVYIMPSPHLTSLAGIPKRVVAGPGANGQGTWQHGRAGSDVTIHVPYGTIIREVVDSRRTKDAWEAEEEALDNMRLSVQERAEKRRERRWVHYPQYEEDNVGRDHFREVEARLAAEERERRASELQRRQAPLFLEYEGVEMSPDRKEQREQEEANRPLGIAKTKDKGVLVAAGGSGGYGNPYFLTSTNRSPKFATRGQEGTRVTLELELKLVADVGLVGFPNAGKSTLLNALTKRRAEVASYAFTTLNPQVGTVRVLEDGDFDGGGVVEESWMQRKRELEDSSSGVEEAVRRPQDDRRIKDEVFRFTIADNPGLIAKASENVGLGHDFLRSMERARALAYVVDLSGEQPWHELATLGRELEQYKEGLSTNCRLVIANKADLLGRSHLRGGDRDLDPYDPLVDDEKVQEAKAKLSFLKTWVLNNLGPLDVVPVSAKYGQNLRRVVFLMSAYVDESRKMSASA